MSGWAFPSFSGRKGLEGELPAWGGGAPARPPSSFCFHKVFSFGDACEGPPHVPRLSHTPPGAWADRGRAERTHVLCTNNQWAVLSLSSLVGPPSRSPSPWPARAWCRHRPSGCRAHRHRLLHLPRGVTGRPQRLKDRLQTHSLSGGRRPASGPPGPLADASLLASPGLCRLGCESVGCLSGRCSQFPF